MAERVFMVHPDLPGQRISAARSGVAARQASGWVLAEGQDQPGGGQVAPGYVHRLLDAYLAGDPVGQVQLGGDAPADVLDRLAAARDEDHQEPAAPAVNEQEE